ASPTKAWTASNFAARICAIVSGIRQPQELTEHRLRLRQIACAKQIQMIEHMIEVVERYTCPCTTRQRPGGLIIPTERRTKAGEQPSQCEIRRTVAVVHRGINQDRSTRDVNRPIASPQIAVQERRLGSMISQQRR